MSRQGDSIENPVTGERALVLGYRGRYPQYENLPGREASQAEPVQQQDIVPASEGAAISTIRAPAP